MCKIPSVVLGQLGQRGLLGLITAPFPSEALSAQLVWAIKTHSSHSEVVSGASMVSADLGSPHLLFKSRISENIC